MQQLKPGKFLADQDQSGKVFFEKLMLTREESLSALLATEEAGFSPGPMLTMSSSTSALTDTIGWFLIFLSLSLLG